MFCTVARPRRRQSSRSGGPCSWLGRAGRSNWPSCVYIYIYIHTCVYIYIYIYILSSSRKQSGRFRYAFHRRHHPTFLYGFRHCCVDAFRRGSKHFLTVSVVGLFLWFPSWQENVCLWFLSLDFWWILPPQEDPTF